MRRFARCVAVFILLLLAISPLHAQDDALTTYTSDELLLSFEYPADWLVTLEFGLGVVLNNVNEASPDEFPVEEGEVEVTILLQSVPSLPVETRPVDLLPEYVDIEAGSEDITIGERPAVQVTHRAGDVLQTWFIFVTDDLRVAIIRFDARRDEVEEFTPTVMAVLESLHFIQPDIVAEHLALYDLDAITLSREGALGGWMFNYPFTWQANYEVAGTARLESGGEQKTTTALKDNNFTVFLRVRTDASFNRPEDVLGAIAPYDAVEFYPIIPFEIDGSPAIRANLQWGGPRATFYIVEIAEHTYAEVRVNARSTPLNSLEPVVLAMIASLTTE